MVRPPRTGSTLLALSSLALLVGCSGGSSPAAQPVVAPVTSTSPSPSETGIPPPEGVVRLSDLTQGQPVPSGRYAAEFVGSLHPAALPLAVIPVPSGYLSGGTAELYTDEGGFRHLALWTVAKVVVDPCSGPAYTDPGPSVRDVADALAALPVWESTTPKPVTMDGHDGLVMDFDVPDPLPGRCGDEPYNWLDDAGGDQAVGPGKHQRLWILDVDGVRVMILAGWFPAGGSDPAAGVTPAKARELVHMAESITFVSPPA